MRNTPSIASPNPRCRYPTSRPLVLNAHLQILNLIAGILLNLAVHRKFVSGSKWTTSTALVPFQPCLRNVMPTRRSSSPLTDLVTPHHVLPTKAAPRLKGPVSLFATFLRRCRGLRLFALLWVMMLLVESRSASAMNANPPVELSRGAMSIRNVCRVHRHRH